MEQMTDTPSTPDGTPDGSNGGGFAGAAPSPEGLPPGALAVIPVAGIGEIRPGDDLAAALAQLDGDRGSSTATCWS